MQSQIEGLLLLCREYGMADMAQRVEAVLCGLPWKQHALAAALSGGGAAAVAWQPLQAVADDPMG